MKVLVDEMDDAVWRAYGEAASPAFVIDLEGRVVLVQPWVEPERLAETLDRMLAESE